MKKRDLPLLIIFPAIIFIDIFIKQTVIHFFNQISYPASDSIPIIGDVLHLTYVQNYGVLFGAFSQIDKSFFMYFFIASLIIILSILIYLFINVPKHFIRSVHLQAKISIFVILSGAISNLADRIFHGYVIDYIDIGISSSRFFVFNFSDICIVGGCIILAFLIIFYENKEPLRNPHDPQKKH